MVLEALPWIGAAFSLYGTVDYMRGVNRRETHPQLASWIGWATANGVLGVLAFLHGNYLAAGFNAVAAAGNLSVLLLSATRRVGVRPRGYTDLVCLALTGVCLLGIVLSHGASSVAFLAMAANIAATWPTIQHAWHKPHEEKWSLFAANAGANGLGLIGVVASGGMGISNIAGPLISMLGNVALVTIAWGRGLAAHRTQSVAETALADEISRLERILDTGSVEAPSDARAGELVTVGNRTD